MSSDPPVKNNKASSGGLLDKEGKIEKQFNKRDNRGVRRLDRDHRKAEVLIQHQYG